MASIPENAFAGFRKPPAFLGALLRVHSQQRTILSPPRALLQPPSPTLPSASSAEPVITPGLPESLG